MPDRTKTRESLIEELAAMRRRVVELEQDGTAVAVAEEALRKFEKAVETMQIGVTITDLEGTILYTNPAEAKMHGYAVDELLGLNAGVFSPSQSDRQALSSHDLALMTSWRRETVNARKDGSVFPVHLMSDVVRNASGEPIGIVSTCEDITERKRVEEQLLHIAVRDGLTGLPNRGVFVRAIARSLGRAARREGCTFAILHLNIDRLKLFNESLGYHAGDRLLVEIASRLQLSVRPSDLLVRLGGDEFGLLVDDIEDVTDATRIASRIAETMAAPFHLPGREVFASASIGIAMSSPRYQHPDEILRDANTAMSRAKARGDARHEVFDSVMHKRALEVLQMETGLRWALERDELLVLYQPIVSLETGKIASLESLVRWNHPERGIVPPDEFIPLAEETGLIIPIGWQVLSMSCKQMQAWKVDLPPGTPIDLCVNLSSKQFMQPDIVQKIKAALGEAQLDPACLRLEMTESALMENAETVFPLLTELQSLNVRLHMDDFGTGYSSLSYLHKLPIDTLKIDRSFVMDLGLREEVLEIVRTIITLAHNLKMQVVAEGVETPQQVMMLRRLGCEYAQGFHFSEPVDGATVSELLRTDTRFL